MKAIYCKAGSSLRIGNAAAEPSPHCLTDTLFDFGSFSTRDPEIEVFSRQGIKRRNFNGL